MVKATIQSSLPASRSRRSLSKPAPQPAAQLKEKAAKRREQAEEVNQAIQEFHDSVFATANQFAERFNKKSRYFLDHFYQGGAHLVHQKYKISAYNAFLHKKAEEFRDSGENPTLDLLHSAAVKEEYEALTEEELTKLVTSHEENKASANVKRPTARGRIQDIAHTTKIMSQLMKGLQDRVGVEGFFCVVRNSTNFHMQPQWYFSQPSVEEYMKTAVSVRQAWDTTEVGAKLEAFAIAGCDVVNMHRTNKQRADALKGEIRDKITSLLVTITGNEKAMMQYSNYEEGIVQRYGVVLEGWTYEKLVNPSTLSTSLPPLRHLRDALISGSCKFVKLTRSQLKEHCEKHQKMVEEGIVDARTRKPRNDLGSKRKHPVAKKSADMIEESGDEQEHSGIDFEDGSGEGHRAKRVRLASPEDGSAGNV